MSPSNRNSASSTAISPAQTNAPAHSLAERDSHREWIAGRALTLLSHYWRDDDPVELTAAIGRDWADVLEGLPQEAIQKAAIKYQRQEPRKKPTPGAIYQLAREDMPRPAPARIGNLTDMRPPDERVSKERAAAIMAEVGFKPRRMTPVED